MTAGRLAAVLAALGLVVVGPAHAAAEPAAAQVGWWTRSPGQEAPAGGFAVATSPDGPVTVAAIGFDAGEGLSSAVIEAVETGGLGQPGAVLQACPTVAPIVAAAGAPLAEAPAPACDQGRVPVERDAEAQRWRVDVTSLVAGKTGAVAVTIVPGDPPEGALGSPVFDVRFAAPAVTVEPAAGSGSESGLSGGFSGSGSPGGGSTGGGPSGDGTGGSTGGGGFGGAGTSSPPPASGSSSSAPGFSPGTARAGFDAPAAVETPAADVASAPQPQAPTSGDEVGQDEVGLGGAPAGQATASFTPVGRDTTGEGARWGQAALFVVMAGGVALTTGFGSRWRRVRSAA